MKVIRMCCAVVAVAVSAALLVGCGGASKASYKKDVKAIGTTVQKDMKKLQEGRPSAADLKDARASLDNAADKLDDLDAPSEVSKLHDDLTDTLRETSKLLGKLSPLLTQATKDPTSLNAKDLTAMNKVTTDFSKIEVRMKKIVKSYKKLDYEIGITT